MHNFYLWIASCTYACKYTVANILLTLKQVVTIKHAFTGQCYLKPFQYNKKTLTSEIILYVEEHLQKPFFAKIYLDAKLTKRLYYSTITTASSVIHGKLTIYVVIDSDEERHHWITHCHSNNFLTMLPLHLASDQDFVVRLVEKEGFMLFLADETLQKNMTVVSEALKSNIHIFKHLSDKIRHDNVFVAELIAREPKLSDFFTYFVIQS